MKKQSKITNLLVIPLIASAIFLAGPAFAADTGGVIQGVIRHKTTIGEKINKAKKVVIGTVISVNNNIILVKSRNNMEYTVDAAKATIMKEPLDGNTNPNIVAVSDVKVGDAIVVRGIINDQEISATKIFDGKMSSRMERNKKNTHARAFIKV